MSDSALSARSRALFAALGASVIAGAAAVAAFAATPSDSGATAYTAVFGRAGQGLDTRSDVKVRGITVGKVAAVSLAPDGKVRVRLQVNRDVQVPRTAEARVDPVSIFGPKEVSLDLGPGAGPFLAEGGTITRTRDAADPSDTASPLYEAARVLDPQDLTTLMHTFSQGLAGQGPALRRTVDNGAKVVDATYARRAEIRRLLDDITALSGTLGGRGDTIVRATGDLGALAPLATERPDKVTQLLDQAGRLSTQVGGTLQDQGGDLGRIIDKSGPAVHVLAGQQENSMMLLDSLNGFFDGLASVMNADGPNGRRPATLRGTLPLDLCQTVVDLCEPARSKNSFPAAIPPG